MIILGINAYHPDASVALLQDGVLVWAAEEERFNRVKHSSGFPEMAIQRCLKETGIHLAKIDAVAISKNPWANFLKKMIYVLQNRPDQTMVLDRTKTLKKSSLFKLDFLRTFNANASGLRAKFIHVEHHQAHMASSFYVSGFDQAACLSIDGLGDFSSTQWGIGDGTCIKIMDRVYFPHSAGFLYTAATQFLGFLHFGDEYKVMGLAAYGSSSYVDLFRKMIILKKNGKFELNLKYFTHPKGQAKLRWNGLVPEQDILYSSCWLNVFGQPRTVGAPITERDQDIAASLQVVLEEIYFHVLRHLHKRTRSENLCLAGGVAFNGVANGKITRNTPFKNIYIPSAAGDAGTAVGAAAFVNHNVYKQPRRFVMNHASFGSNQNNLEIQAALEGRGLQFETLSEDHLIQKTTKLLIEGKVVGWFQGRMEFGPRALGNRSILADPRRPEMKDILNHRIKHREGFRPFAPAVPEEKARDYFEMDGASPFMLQVFPVREEKAAEIPAVTHLDGSARVQTVSKESQSLFWKLLMQFGRETGTFVLLNTSFNENEPIVCTPEDAVECFLKTKMDSLVIGPFICTQKNSDENTPH